MNQTHLSLSNWCGNNSMLSTVAECREATLKLGEKRGEKSKKDSTGERRKWIQKYHHYYAVLEFLYEFTQDSSF